MNTAYLIKTIDVSESRKQAFYFMSPPHNDCQLIMVSSVYEVLYGYTLYETYLFEANKDLEVVSYSELPGSTRGTTDHKEVLENIGYEIKS